MSVVQNRPEAVGNAPSIARAGIPVVFVLPDLGGGGAQKVILSVAGTLDRVQFAPRIVALGGSQALAEEVPSHVPTTIGEASRVRQSVPWLLRQLRTQEPAIYVSVMGYMNLLMLALKPALPRGSRVIVREANALAASLAVFPPALPSRFLYQILYGRADAVVCPTVEIRDELAGLSRRISQRAHVIANPVNVATLCKRGSAPRRKPGPGPRFVSAGRLTRQKGFDQMIDMLPLLPGDTHVTVFGEGPDRAALEQQARDTGMARRIEFAGFTRDLPAWIAGADAFLLPSRWEGLPNVVLEALALGTPVVMSDQIAAKELAIRADADALRIAAPGPAFASAAADFIHYPAVRLPRRCLLPEAYRAECVSAQWDRLFRSCG